KTKAIIERAGIVAKANNDMFKGKIGASLVIARRAGASFTFASINFFFFSSQMILPGSAHWNMCYGKNPGDIKNDTEGIQILNILGENIINLLKSKK
ncbi:MAG: flavodoxin family protein, partial [Actinobacteria bacterium]|nr:flavodoxin family protein [Actinomycetota bacterium]